MPYIPRSPTLMNCAHCGVEFVATNLNRKYCCNSCNVLASYARNGRPGERTAQRAAELAASKSKIEELAKTKTKLRNLKKELSQL